MNRSRTAIADFMQRYELSQNALARHLNTTATTVARWRADGHPNRMQLMLMLDQLAVRLEAAKVIEGK